MSHILNLQGDIVVTPAGFTTEIFKSYLDNLQHKK